MAFNPNYDNAKFQAGQAELANAIWLLTWREMLELARAKGGCVVQMLVPPGLSKMQEAEADMAKDKGVPVVVLDCRQVWVSNIDISMILNVAPNSTCGGQRQRRLT